MEAIFNAALGLGLENLLAGGPKAIIVLLCAFIFYQWKQITALRATITKLEDEIADKDSKFLKIIDDYYKGNMTLADALNQLKIVLMEIRVKI